MIEVVQWLLLAGGLLLVGVAALKNGWHWHWQGRAEIWAIAGLILLIASGLLLPEQ